MKNLAKIILLLVTVIVATNFVKAQDIIVTFDSKSIKSKVLEVSNYEIKYLDFENQEGPSNIIMKSDVKMIIYQNGMVEDFQYYEPQYEDNYFVRDPNLKSYEELMNLNDVQKGIYLSTIGVNSIYEKFMRGQKLRTTGRNLSITGLGLSVVGIGAIVASVFMLEGGNDFGVVGIFFLGSTAIFVGQGLILASIPFSAIGGGTKKSAENMYRDYYFGKDFSSYQPKLDLGFTNHGFGLSLKF